MAELSCGGTCMKYILFIFNFVFWLSGAAILAVGIWLKVDPNVNKFLDVIRVDTTNPFIDTAIIVLIAVGAFIFLVGFLGCCGACKESSCMLCMYIILLVLVILLEIAAGVLAIVFQSQLDEELRSSMGRQARTDVDDIKVGVAPSVITAAWAAMQSELKCCGGYNYLDYRDYNPKFNTSYPVPVTCCTLADKNPDNPIAENLAQCFADAATGNRTVDSKDLYVKGCYDSLIDWFYNKRGILIGVGIGVAAIQLVGIVFACCVRSQINKQEDYS